MRLVNIDNVSPGMRLGESIHGLNAQVLLRRGVWLSKAYLASLREMGLPALYIDDDDTSDIAIPQTLTPETRCKVLKNLTQAFQAVNHQTKSFRDSSMSVAMEHLKSDRFAKAVSIVANDPGFANLFDDVETVLDQLMDKQVLVGLNSIRTHDNYTYQHSIDVTIMGLMLAKRAGWGAERLRAFGIGLILHDIGKIFIDLAILNKSAQLSGDEFEIIKAHPVVGYELIRAIAPSLGSLAPQVAYQHHEREDGTGYPRGLRGDNVLGANKSGQIHEFGSVCAVADVYDALTSQRCYRKGWTAARTIEYIRSMSGRHFNRKAVSIFTSVVAPFPVCSEVLVTSGKYAGYTGVVSDVPPRELGRPTVRLLYDPNNQRIDPVEVDLLVERDVTIEPAGDGDRPAQKLAG